MNRGVTFERYEGMAQDDLAIWSPAPGVAVAWFKDSDGNLLSLSQTRARGRPRWRASWAIRNSTTC